MLWWSTSRNKNMRDIYIFFFLQETEYVKHCRLRVEIKKKLKINDEDERIQSWIAILTFACLATRSFRNVLYSVRGINRGKSQKQIQLQNLQGPVWFSLTSHNTHFDEFLEKVALRKGGYWHNSKIVWNWRMWKWIEEWHCRQDMSRLRLW